MHLWRNKDWRCLFLVLTTRRAHVDRLQLNTINIISGWRLRSSSRSVCFSSYERLVYFIHMRGGWDHGKSNDGNGEPNMVRTTTHHFIFAIKIFAELFITVAPIKHSSNDENSPLKEKWCICQSNGSHNCAHYSRTKVAQSHQLCLTLNYFQIN